MQCLGHHYTKTLLSFIGSSNLWASCVEGQLSSRNSLSACLGKEDSSAFQSALSGSRGRVHGRRWQRLQTPPWAEAVSADTLTACVGAQRGRMSRARLHGPVALFLPNILADSWQKGESLGAL